MNVREFFDQNSKIVIFDMEYTSWEGTLERGWNNENEHREIIQIAAVKVDLDSCKEIDTFERFVKPEINTELSDYIKNLTHISQGQTDAGVDFKDMYRDFMEWSEGLLIYSYSGGIDIGGMHKTADGRVFKENIDLYKLDLLYPEERFRNIAEVFKSAGINTKEYSSGLLYTYFGIEMDPAQIHNAMHDVRSLEFSLYELKKLGSST